MTDRARIAKKARVGSASTPLSFLRKAPETPGDAQQREGCKLALVSHELHRALSTWAVPSAPSCSSSFDVVGAGAVLCDYAKSGGGVAAGALQDNSSCVLAGLLLLPPTATLPALPLQQPETATICLFYLKGPLPLSSNRPSRRVKRLL